MYRITSLSVAAAGRLRRKKRRFARICGCESGGATRLCRGVLRSSHACQYVSIGVFCVRFTPVNMFLLGRFAFDSRLSLFLCQEKRDGLRDVAFLFRRGSESPLVRSHDFARLSDFAGSLRVCPFLYGDSDGNPEEVQKAIGKPPGERTSLEQKSYPCAVTRNAGCRAPQSSCKPIVFLWRSDCAFAATPRGVRWGSAPQTAPKSLRLSGLSSFDSRPCALYAAWGLRYNGDLTGSDKRRPHCGWPGKSCGVARQQVEAAQRPA